MELISASIIIILFIIGILFIIWSISYKYKTSVLVKKCTNRCDGTLIKINEIEINHQNDEAGRWYTTKSYVPIYEYKVQKK